MSSKKKTQAEIDASVEAAELENAPATVSEDEIETVDAYVPAETEAEAAENVMYLGPTIVGVVRHSTVFEGGVLPDKVTECVSKLPAMKYLFVPISQLVEAAKDMNKKKSKLNAISAAVSKAFK